MSSEQWYSDIGAEGLDLENLFRRDGKLYGIDMIHRTADL